MLCAHSTHKIHSMLFSYTFWSIRCHELFVLKDSIFFSFSYLDFSFLNCLFNLSKCTNLWFEKILSSNEELIKFLFVFLISIWEWRKPNRKTEYERRKSEGKYVIESNKWSKDWNEKWAKELNGKKETIKSKFIEFAQVGNLIW